MKCKPWYSNSTFNIGRYLHWLSRVIDSDIIQERKDKVEEENELQRFEKVEEKEEESIREWMNPCKEK